MNREHVYTLILKDNISKPSSELQTCAVIGNGGKFQFFSGILHNPWPGSHGYQQEVPETVLDLSGDSMILRSW